MTGGYWYIEGGDDRHFCYAKTPSFVCRHADGDDLGRLAGLAAEERGITRLAEIVRNAHRRSVSSIRARDAAGKLTDDCAVCGAKLKRLGFAVWEERPAGEETSQHRIAQRLGFGSHVRVGETKYRRTKKAASDWAAKNAKASREAAGKGTSE